MSVKELKEKVCDGIEARSKDIIKVGETIWKRPELGYKEFETSKYVRKKFDELGLDYEADVAITGLVAKLSKKPKRPTIAVYGELDAIICPMHPNADPVTGAAHACGHNGQIATMLGVGMGFVDTGILKDLTGNIALMAVPAEEYLEIEYRLGLKEQGKIQFLGGKQEFIRLGKFDDVDITLNTHIRAPMPERKVEFSKSLNGFIGKSIRYIGKESHAGAAPDKGINALNAALLGIMGIHAQRETFKEEDTIRIHPIITKGGDMVNNVPADVKIETYVRGKTIEAIMDASKKVNRALRAGAMAIGAEVEITEIPGYMPSINDAQLTDLMKKNAIHLLGEENIKEDEHRTGSSDVGDISCIMPSSGVNVGGVSGNGHSRDLKIVDPYMTYVVPAKIIAMTIVDLLSNNAAKAKEILSSFKPRIPRESYMDYWNKLLTDA